MSRWQQIIVHLLAEIESTDPNPPEGFRIAIDDAIWQTERGIVARAELSHPTEEPDALVREFLAELLEAVSERLKTDPSNKAFQEAKSLLENPRLRVAPDQRPT